MKGPNKLKDHTEIKFTQILVCSFSLLVFHPHISSFFSVTVPSFFILPFVVSLLRYIPFLCGLSFFILWIYNLSDLIIQVAHYI